MRIENWLLTSCVMIYLVFASWRFEAVYPHSSFSVLISSLLLFLTVSIPPPPLHRLFCQTYFLWWACQSAARLLLEVHLLPGTFLTSLPVWMCVCVWLKISLAFSEQLWLTPRSVRFNISLLLNLCNCSSIYHLHFRYVSPPSKSPIEKMFRIALNPLLNKAKMLQVSCSELHHYNCAETSRCASTLRAGGRVCVNCILCVLHKAAELPAWRQRKCMLLMRRSLLPFSRLLRL